MSGAVDGNTVSVHYTGKLSDGTVFDTSEGREALQFTLGKNMVVDGFEENIKGMKVGESKTFTVASEKAYGPRQDVMVIQVPRTAIKAEQEVSEGMQFAVKAPNGQTLNGTVVSVSEEALTLDFNHPLAGKDLTFEVKVEKIE